MERVPLVKKKAKPKPTAEEQVEEAPVQSEPEGKFLTIDVGKDWRLVWDGMQFQIRNRKIREKDGQPYWSTKAYVCHLDDAIIWLGRRQIYQTSGTYDDRSLDHFCEVLDEIKENCRAAMQKGEVKCSGCSHSMLVTDNYCRNCGLRAQRDV